MHLEGIDYRGYLNGRTYGFWQAAAADDWRLHVKHNQTANDLILDSFVTLVRGALRDLERRGDLTGVTQPSDNGAIRVGELFIGLCSEIARVKTSANEQPLLGGSAPDERQLTKAAEELMGAERLYGFATHLIAAVRVIETAAGQEGRPVQKANLDDLSEEIAKLRKRLRKTYLFLPANAEIYVRRNNDVNVPGKAKGKAKMRAEEVVLREMDNAFEQGRATAKRELDRFPVVPGKVD